MRHHWLAMTLSFIAMHCGGTTRTNPSDLCTAGAKVDCECGRIKGTQTCADDGASYGACSCDDNGNPTNDAGNQKEDGRGPLACTSGSSWSGGMTGSAFMMPGSACLDCHRNPTAPTLLKLTAAGTIYPALSDPDDCNGIDGTMVGIAVAFMDESNLEIVPRLAVNRAGNFVGSRALPARFRTKIIFQGQEFPMKGVVTDGNCNACHTAKGASGASGRLTQPRF